MLSKKYKRKKTLLTTKTGRRNALLALIHCWGEAKIGSNQDDLNNHCRKVAILAIRTKNRWKKEKKNAMTRTKVMRAIDMM